MIAGEGRTIYVSGDTDVMADMAVFEDLHHSADRHPVRRRAFHDGHEAGRLCGEALLQLRGGDPCHYRTFPLLEQSAEVLAAELPGVRVIEPQVLEPIVL